VNFSGPVTGVGGGAFTLQTDRLSGAAIVNVTGVGAIYTVVVSTGSGAGTCGST